LRKPQYFQVGDEVLWNPSNGVAALFLRSAEALAAEAGVPSGLGPMQEDECQVDVVAFTAFVSGLTLRFQASNHPIWRSLTEGFIATSLVLVERAGGKVTTTAHSSPQLWDEFRERHSLAMAR
jgi:hypothetical protein